MNKMMSIIRLPLVLVVSFTFTFHSTGLSNERSRDAVNDKFDIVEIISVEERVITQNSDAPLREFSGATKIGIATILGSVAAAAALWFCTKAHEQTNPLPVPKSPVKLGIKKQLQTLVENQPRTLVDWWESCGMFFYKYSNGDLEWVCAGA